MTSQKEQEGLGRKNKRGDRKGESNDSPEIPDRRETSDTPGLPSALGSLEELWLAKIRERKRKLMFQPGRVPSLFLKTSVQGWGSRSHQLVIQLTLQSQSQDPLGHVHCTSKSCMHRTAIGVNNFHQHFSILCYTSLMHHNIPGFLVH